jgi:hypothetical protein
MQTIWTRSTPNFTVSLAYDWDDDMDLSWDDTGEAREKIESGEWGHYLFRVDVTENATGAVLGVDYLGGSIYADPAEFVDHRQCGRQNREYAARGEAGRCGSYFTDMVGEAISEARKTYQTQHPQLRAA